MKLTLDFTGDWGKAREIQRGALREAIRRGMVRSIRKSALIVQRRIKENIARGRPEHAALHPFTIERKGSARTLWSTTDGRHYVNVRRLLNFIEESSSEGNRWAVFEPNDPKLWRQVTRINDFPPGSGGKGSAEGATKGGERRLRGLWQAGMLFPSTDVKKAFFVKCDEETNPRSEIDQGRVWCEIGVNPPYPAEFVIFRIGLWDGGTSVAEEMQNR